MDTIILFSIAIGIFSLIISLTFLSRRNSDNKNNAAREQVPQVRRAAGIRNARRRMQGGRVPHENTRDNQNTHAQGGDREGVDEEEADDDNEGTGSLDHSKVGTKKRAKLEAKAEKKQQREALEKEREERKMKDEMLKVEAEKQREKEKIEQVKQEEAERKAREEKERQEHDEYLKMKEAFSVEEEGFDQDEIDEENLLQQFLQYIKFNKIVMLNDLVSHFKLKHENVVERIQDLQANGSLTGVIDDRGKFIYISPMELEAVAKFVKQRGRVSIVDLAENSNRLINLNPDNVQA